MSLFFSNKAVRLLLSISVSIWMAGGCLFGCSNTTMALTDDTRQTHRAGKLSASFACLLRESKVRRSNLPRKATQPKV